MLYLLDANVLITASNTYYQLDRVPEFWTWLIHQGESGNVKIPREIFEEITDGNDDLAQWAKRDEVQNALIFDEDVDVDEVRKVIEEGYANDLSDEELIKVGRDPFLVAYASVDRANRKVVTTEVSKPRRVRGNRHVPDVCRDFGVVTCDTFQLMNELDFHTDWM